MNVWLTFLAAGLVTFAIRLSFIWMVGHRDVPVLLRRALRFVPPAVLTAIIFPELLVNSGQLDFSLHNPRLLAGLLAALVAWRTRSPALTILVGMLALWVLQGLIG